MNVGTSSRRTLPLVRLNLVLPLVALLEERGVKADSVLATFGLSRLVVEQSDMFMPAARLYEVVEAIAKASGDPYFGLHAGERLDLPQWTPFSKGSRSAITVGDLLLQFSLDAQNEASSVTYVTTVAGGKTTFREQRLAAPGLVPRHNDAFTVGYLLRILKHATGHQTLGQSVLARLCTSRSSPRVTWA
jgi:hypothetical protein